MTTADGYSPVFLRLRMIAFFCLTLASLVWIVLLCCEIYLRWTITDKVERSLIVVILVVNAMTVLMVPILIMLRFRPWLDGARFLLLLSAHIGTAAAFSYWSPRFSCPSSGSDQEGTCELITLYITIGNWANPALQLAYAFGLLLMVYCRSRRLSLEAEFVTPTKNLMDDEDARTTDLEKPNFSAGSSPVRLPYASSGSSLSSPVDRPSASSSRSSISRPSSTKHQSYFSMSHHSLTDSLTARTSVYSQASAPRWTTADPLPVIAGRRSFHNANHLLHIQTDLPPMPPLPSSLKYHSYRPVSSAQWVGNPVVSSSPRGSRSSNGSNGSGGYLPRVERNIQEVDREERRSRKGTRLSRPPRSPLY